MRIGTVVLEPDPGADVLSRARRTVLSVRPEPARGLVWIRMGCGCEGSFRVADHPVGGVTAISIAAGDVLDRCPFCPDVMVGRITVQ